MTFLIMKMFRCNCHRWLVGIGVVTEDYIQARVRRSYGAPFKVVYIPSRMFFRRVTEARVVIMRFWLVQIHNGTQRLCVSPVPHSILRAASWVFGLDFTRRGALNLRVTIGSALGYYPQGQNEDIIWRCMLRRKVPSIEQLVENTCY